MSMQSRLDAYKAMTGPKGEASSEENIAYWQRRAERNSYRGSGDNFDVTRSDEKNNVGSSFMPGVRRQA